MDEETHWKKNYLLSDIGRKGILGDLDGKELKKL